MRYFLLFLCLICILWGCGAAEEPTVPSAQTVPTATEPTETSPPAATAPPAPDPVQDLLESLTLEEKVGQILLARCDQERALQDIETYHLGGYILFSEDFEQESPDSLRTRLKSYQQSSKIPMLLAVDEEGGTVTRISRFKAFRSSPFPSPRQTYKDGGLAGALATEEDKSLFLADLGLNVNMGPVCDLCSDPNGFMYQRSFGQTPETTGEFVAFTVDIMERFGIGSVLKHFPGYGNNSDTHVGIAVDSRSLAELEDQDLIPFQYGIRAGCGAVLVSHTIVECLDADLPASLSPAVHDYLRQDMGYNGVIVTDDLVMQAITDRYGAGESAVLALNAGNDLLCSTDYAVQFDALLAALAEGRIGEERLDAAVYRVLKWKQDLGLL